MELDRHVTQDKYLAYLIATQSKWNIDDLASYSQYAQIIKALETNKRVKHLCLHCGLHGGLREADLLKLATSLEANKTLEALEIRGLFDPAEHALAEIFHVLARKPKFNILELYDLTLATSAWHAFLEFIRAQPQLKQLTLLNLNESQVIELMDALQDHNELTDLNLGGENSGTLESLKAVARYVSKSTKLTRLFLNEDDLTATTAAEVIEIMQNNTSLHHVPSYGAIATSEFVKRNKEAHLARQSKARDEMAAANSRRWQPPPLLAPSLSLDLIIEQLPNDIIRVILWQLPIKPLLNCKRVDKWFYKFMNNEKFWRGFYLKFFSCIPGDILALTDITYGAKLMAASSMDDITTSVWEEIVINSFRARIVGSDVFPTNYCVPSMEPVFHQYPQLIGTKQAECSVDVFPPDRWYHKTKDAPYSNTWFTLFANNAAVYHLGFERLHDGQYNGILLLAPDCQVWRERFTYMVYIFDWFSAKSEAEFADKMKPLCEVYLTARENYNHCYNTMQEPFNKYIEGLMKEAVNKRHKTVQAINFKIEQSAKDYCSEQGIDHANSASFIKAVDQLASYFKGASDGTFETEFSQLKQKMPVRSELNQKYGLDNGLFHNFNTYLWSTPNAAGKKDFKIHHSNRKQSKPVGHVALMKLYRVALNFTLMAVLKTFWPVDIDHPDCELYPFIKWVKDAKTFYRAIYYPTHYTAFSNVSVSNASPAQWPLIAVGLAKLLLPTIISKVNRLIQKQETTEMFMDERSSPEQDNKSNRRELAIRQQLVESLHRLLPQLEMLASVLQIVQQMNVNFAV